MDADEYNCVQHGVLEPEENEQLLRLLRRAPRVGERAPRLELRDLDGRATGLGDPRARPVLVSFLRHAG